MIIAVINQKGGVGKTTTVVNLGAALAEAGCRVLLVDLDLQRDLSSHAALGAMGNPVVVAANATVLPDLLHAHPHDIALLDCPPALSEEAGAALGLSDIALVPVVPEFLAVRGLSRLLQTVAAARRGNPQLRARSLITMLDRRSKSAPTYTRALQNLHECRALQTVIGRSILFERASAQGQSVLTHAPRGSGAADYRALAQELLTLNGAKPNGALSDGAKPQPQQPGKAKLSRPKTQAAQSRPKSKPMVGQSKDHS